MSSSSSALASSACPSRKPLTAPQILHVAQPPPILPMDRYGCVVVGAPGAGKTTLVGALARYLTLHGRSAAIVCLDPAMDGPVADAYADHLGVDVRELVHAPLVAEAERLGPNGTLLWCARYMLENADWLAETIAARCGADAYLIIDLPGQAELWTHDDVMPRLLHALSAALRLRLAGCHLVDVTHCCDAGRFIASALVALTAMLRLELPLVNVLSKCDTLPRLQGEMAFGIDYYADATELRRLLPFVNGRHFADGDGDDAADDAPPQPQTPWARRHAKLNERVTELVDEFGLLQFTPVDVTVADSVAALVGRLDRACGYAGDEAAQQSKGAPAELRATMRAALVADVVVERAAGGGGGTPVPMAPR